MGYVFVKLNFQPNYIHHHARQIIDPDVRAEAEVQMLDFGIMLREKRQPVCIVVHLQKLAHGQFDPPKPRGKSRHDVVMRPNRAGCQANEGSDRLEGEDHQTYVGNRSEFIQLQAKRGELSRLRSVSRQHLLYRFEDLNLGGFLVHLID